MGGIRKLYDCGTRFRTILASTILQTITIDTTSPNLTSNNISNSITIT